MREARLTTMNYEVVRSINSLFFFLFVHTLDSIPRPGLWIQQRTTASFANLS